jgi:prolyl oligopeptidase
VYGSTLYVLTDKDTPNRKILVVDLEHPNLAHAPVLVPESQKVLRDMYASADALYVRTRLGLKFEILRIPFNKKDKLGPIPLPYQGTIGGIDANPKFTDVVFGLTSWTRSFAAFSYDPASGRITALDLIPKNPVDYSSVVAREVDVRSTDGALVPLSILCRKDIILDGSHPTQYEGYGSYGSSSDPYFDPISLAWIERGGVIAVVHARGGGEYGESWHSAGKKSTKQHTIDDMIAAARYLIENRYTSPKHLAVRGTSAGGIAVGGALVQHPELFAVAVDDVGVTDLLRFQQTQGGAANIPELGDVRDPQDFKYMYAISPYHHVVEGTSYPAVLAMTGVHDPRVPSWIIAKMVARLQAASSSGKPVLLRVDFDAGHGFGSTRTQDEEKNADEWSFLLWQLGDPEFTP